MTDEQSYDPNELLSVSDVAKELDVTEDWVRKLIRRGHLVANKVGKINYVVKRGDLIKYIQDKENKENLN